MKSIASRAFLVASIQALTVLLVSLVIVLVVLREINRTPSHSVSRAPRRELSEQEMDAAVQLLNLMQTNWTVTIKPRKP